jgi:predicted O-methyltransferase YrrM
VTRILTSCISRHLASGSNFKRDAQLATSCHASKIGSRSNSVLSESAYTDDVIDLMYKLIEYRNQETRHRLETVDRAAPMLHRDVLLLIYHFARVAKGDVLEIGPYVGGSTIAAAFGARESGRSKKIVSVEAGGRLKHHRIPSRNIFKDLKKNLARFRVSESVTLINGYSFQETTISAIRQMLGPGEVGLFIFDADATCAVTWIVMAIC